MRAFGIFFYGMEFGSLLFYSLVKAGTVVKMNERTSSVDCVERPQSHDRLVLFLHLSLFFSLRQPRVLSILQHNIAMSLDIMLSGHGATINCFKD